MKDQHKHILTIACLIFFVLMLVGLAFILMDNIPFRIILLIFAGLLVYVIYGELKYVRGRYVTLNDNDIPRELVIKPSKAYAMAESAYHIVFIIVGYFMVSITGFKFATYERSDYILFGIGVLFIVAYSVKIINKLAKAFNDKGITLSEQGIATGSSQMHWSDISKEKVISKMETDYTSKYRIKTKVYYISFRYKGNNTEISLDGMDQPDYVVEQYLKVYRERYNRKNRG